MLVGRGVDQEGGGAEEGGLEVGGDIEEEEDGYVGGRSEGRDDGLGGYGLEVEGCGKGDQLGVVVDVFGDAGVVASYLWSDGCEEEEGDGIRSYQL